MNRALREDLVAAIGDLPDKTEMKAFCGRTRKQAALYARSVQELAAARAIAVTWVSVTLIAAVLVGVMAVGYLDTPLTGADSEKVFMEMVRILFHPLVAGVCLAAILAAIMSTADSQLLVASAALSDDFYKAFLRPQAGAAELVWMGRLAVLALAAVAIFLAMDPENRVLDLVAYAWAGFGAAFGPVILGHAHPVVNQRVQEAIQNAILFAWTTPQEIQVAEALALQAGMVWHLAGIRGEAARLKEELQTRKRVDRAKEVLMDQRDLTAEEAYRWIQKRSMDTRRSMRAVAETIIMSETTGHYTSIPHALDLLNKPPRK